MSKRTLNQTKQVDKTLYTILLSCKNPKKKYKCKNYNKKMKNYRIKLID